MPNISKFNIQEIFSDNSGKSSASSFGGVITVVLSVITFTYACFSHYEMAITQSVIMAGIGSALLGVNKWRDSTTPIVEETVEPDKTDTTETS